MHIPYEIQMYILKISKSATYLPILVNFLTEEFEDRNSNSMTKQFTENAPLLLNKIEAGGNHNCNCCNSLIPCYNVQMILE